MTLYIAFSYGGRRELLDAAEGLAAEYAASRGSGGGRARRSGRRAPPRVHRRRPPASPLRTRDARPGAAHPHLRGAPHQQLPALAVRLLGAVLQRPALARLRAGGPGRGAGRLRRPPAPLRRPPRGRAARPRRLAAGDAGGRTPRDDAHHHRRRPRPCSPSSSSSHGGLIFFALMAALALLGLNEFYRLTRKYRPLPLAGFLGVALMVSMAWFFSPFAVFGADLRRRAVHRAARPAGRPQAGRDRAHGGHAARHALHRARVQRRHSCCARWTRTG